MYDTKIYTLMSIKIQIFGVNMSINKRFKEIRLDNNLSQKEFADIILLKTRQVTEIDRGNQKVSIDIASNIETPNAGSEFVFDDTASTSTVSIPLEN